LRALLDTSTFLWAVGQRTRLSETGRAILDDDQNELYFSAVSAWEIAVKHAKGQLDLLEDPATFVQARINALALQPLVITVEHALRAGTLPASHRDPFDRMLIAQSQIEALPIITSDGRIAQYDVETIW
jgi:PIN domain nuclease of toxin-antitoxin system